MSFVITRDRMKKLLFEYFERTPTAGVKYTIDDIDFFINEGTFKQAMLEASNYNCEDIHEFESYLVGYLGEHIRIGKRILAMNDTKVLRAFLGFNEENIPNNVLSQLIDLLSKEDIVDSVKSDISRICDIVSAILEYDKLDAETKAMLKKILEKELQDIVRKVIDDNL